MKKLIKFSLVLIAMAAFSFSSFAQNSASTTANTSATIVSPITISNTADLAFGNIVVDASTAGTVLLPASAAATRVPGGGCSLPATTGTFTAAAFTVGGQSGYAYSVTLPSSVSITETGGDVMTVNTFTDNSATVGTIGGETLYVGATINVTGGQTPGLYESGTDFTVTVAYD